MRFADKLSYLMSITQTSNKVLAAELGIDRSLVSMMRTGSRGMPRKKETVRNMALFFARHSTADFQRHAISEMLGQTILRSAVPVEVLAYYLEKWLRGELGLVEQIVEGIGDMPVNAETFPEGTVPAPTPGKGADFFYGEEGRRESLRLLLRNLRSMEKPCSLLMVVEDNLEWLLSDYVFMRQTQAELLELVERGFTIYQIMPPMNYVNRYTESLKFWLPVYATGKVKVYYYPRLRGNLYRHTSVTVPGHFVKFSTAVALGSSEITFFSSEPELVSTFVSQFNEYIAQCRPAVFFHSRIEDGVRCFSEMLSRPGDIVQMVDSLSLFSAPAALLSQYVQETETPGWREIFQLYLDGIDGFEQRLCQSVFIDIGRLASAEEVRAGKVFILSNDESARNYPCYTPETYVMHLKNILRLMDTYENYTFLPLREKEARNYNLFASEGGVALLVRTAQPILTMEMRRAEMVLAFREHLLRKAEAVGYQGMEREKIRMELRSLIRQLQD